MTVKKPHLGAILGSVISVIAMVLGAVLSVVPASATPSQAAADPQGVIDFIGTTGTAGQLRIAGWTFDANAPTAQTDIHVYVDGAGSQHATGDSRPDVKAAFPQAGLYTGFDMTLIVSGGSHHVTVYAINQGLGNNTVLWNGDIKVVDPNPIGYLDTVTPAGSGQVRVTGWTFDQSSPMAAIPVHVYVVQNGARAGFARSTGSYRPDVQAMLPQTTANQGFDLTLPASSGEAQVCAFGINIGLGDNTLLGCLNVTVS